MTDIDDEKAQGGENPLATKGRVWKQELERAERYFQKWKQRCEKIEKIFIEERQSQSNSKRNFPMLWANISVLQPAVYARPPQAAVDRRFKDADPISRTTSEMLERAIEYQLERGDIDTHMRDCRDDFLLFARATAWARYEADFEEYEADVPSGQEKKQEEIPDEDTSPTERIAGERVCVEYVHWSDFLHDPARRWQDVTWVARQVFLSTEEIEERFGEKASSKLPVSNKKAGSTDAQTAQEYGKTGVWEIWDKVEGECIWIADGASEALEVSDPPLDLDDFFPCPKPAYGTLSTNSLLPIPDYVYYQGQVEEIDTLTARIAKLTDQLALKGFYPGGEGDVTDAIERGLRPGNDTIMIPIPSWAAFAEKGGAAAIVWIPIDQVQKTIAACIEARKQLIEDVYQITGISDIVRGDSQASETATAQRLKSQWGSIRIRDRQAELARFARDIVRIVGEIIGDQFQPETLLMMTNMQLLTDADKHQFQMQVQQMQQAAQQQAAVAQITGQQPPPAPQPPQPPKGMDDPSIDDVMRLLRDDLLRSFRVDIETDSTITPDEDAEKQRRTEFMQVLGGFMQQAVPAGQTMPQMIPAIGETILWVARAFRAGRELEGVFERVIGEVSQIANAPKPPPQPSPDEQIKLETTKVKAQAEQTKAQLSVAQAQAEHHQGAQQMAMESAQNERQHAMDLQKMQMQHRQAMQTPPGVN